MTSVSKQGLVHNLSYRNDIFLLHVHCLANQSHFHMKVCEPELCYETEIKSNSEMAYWPLHRLCLQALFFLSTHYTADSGCAIW